MRRHTLIDRAPVLIPEGEAWPAGEPTSRPPLIDGHGRRVTYLRLSVTDRCDLRCTYCMPERMTFLPKRDLLSLDELAQLADGFISRGVRKIRITGGEPLLRKDMPRLLSHLGHHVRAGHLDELTLTTNGTQLARFTPDLVAAGVKRVNVSLDHLDPVRFRTITRGGDIAKVFEGIAAAQQAGLFVKINMVVLAGVNDDHVAEMMRWAHDAGHDLTLIEAMPLGDAGGDRSRDFVSLADVKSALSKDFTLIPSRHSTGGPSRYFDVAETGGRIGFITPLSQNFCDGCNRVRLTCTGQLYSCLGHEGAADLRSVLRAGGDVRSALDAALDAALGAKPARHDFDLERPGQLATPRHMSVTGG